MSTAWLLPSAGGRGIFFVVRQPGHHSRASVRPTLCFALGAPRSSGRPENRPLHVEDMSNLWPHLGAFSFQESPWPRPSC